MRRRSHLLREPGHDDEWIVEQDLRIQILVLDRRHHPPEDEVDAALAQITVQRRDRGGLFHGEYQTRILPGQPIDHSRKQPRAHHLVAPDPHLSAAGSAKSSISRTPWRKSSKDRGRPLEQGAAIERWLDALRRAIEQRHAERVAPFRQSPSIRRVGKARVARRPFPCCPPAPRSSECAIRAA